ncbi:MULTISPECIES: thermonuclease family protein [unclassified Rhizobium]|uniref:thermonuclease family protein n=1 Tax=unclassified Rhizobium TaxID=2613769 RepID=UPI000EAA250B|nr:MULTISPECIES: thermonuclease family protein [unclassified Rhizobium]AYG65786.1 thermonuclease family protein [Rhizobium sp. CCGE531]AYG72267.1 thermonuclease family protein [Rhizobium sp. CCGE532]
MVKAKRRTRRRPQSKAGTSMWLWGAVGLATVAGIYAYQHRKEMPSMLAHAGAVAGMPHMTQEAPVPAAKPQIKTAAITPEPRATSALPVPPAAIPVALPVSKIPIERPVPSLRPQTGGRFVFCGRGSGTNCVVDGNTFWQNGARIQLADIDVPDADAARCPGERQKAAAAKLRLQAILNDGTFVLSGSNRPDDRNGGKLRIAMRAGRSIGDQMVSEGLAHRWTGQVLSWCG